MRSMTILAALTVAIVACSNQPPRPSAPVSTHQALLSGQQLAQRTVYVDVPELADGDAQDVAVEITYPKSHDFARYDGVAPIVIEVPGAEEMHGVFYGPSGATQTLAPRGFVHINFLHPGAQAQGASSDGTKDYRGARSRQALAAVIEFAIGARGAYPSRAPAAVPRLLQWHLDNDADAAVAPVADHTNVGLLGRSYGGNMAIVTMGTDGARFWVDTDGDGNVAGEPGLRWFVSYESPVSDGFATVLYGGQNLGQNPEYTPNSCALASCTVNLSAIRTCHHSDGGDCALKIDDLRSNSGVDVWVLHFFDRNGNGSYDHGTDQPVARFTGFTSAGAKKVFYSYEVASHLFGTSPPADANIGDVAATGKFWLHRDPSRTSGGWYREIVDGDEGHLRHLKVMVVAQQIDHAQRTEDHAHIKVQYEAWQNQGVAWVRLNPDSAYSQSGCASDCTEENAANVALSWASTTPGSGSCRLYSDGCSMDADPLVAAGVEEMADRQHDGTWVDNLASRLH